MTPTNWLAVAAVIIIVLAILGVRARKMDQARAKNKADGVTAYIGDLRMTPTELLIGEQRYPIEGLHATVEDSGTVNRRFTLTRLAVLGVAAVAIPKKLDDRDVYLTVEGPGLAVVRVLHVKKIPNAGAVARQFAATLNSRAGQPAVAEP